MVKKVSINETQLRIISLFLNQYDKRIHLRRMAVLLNTNHRTIALNIKKLEDLKVFGSEMVGRNKEFFLNMDNILTEHFICLAEHYVSVSYLSNNFIMREILRDFEKNVTPESSIILFGSRAKGGATKNSDVDIFVLGKLEHRSFINDTESKINLKINVKIAKHDEFSRGLRAKDYLSLEILKNHVILKNSSSFVDIIWRYYERIRHS
jgi:predicted nucleotidyltransferase